MTREYGVYEGRDLGFAEPALVLDCRQRGREAELEVGCCDKGPLFARTCRRHCDEGGASICRRVRVTDCYADVGGRGNIPAMCEASIDSARCVDCHNFADSTPLSLLGPDLTFCSDGDLVDIGCSNLRKRFERGHVSADRKPPRSNELDCIRQSKDKGSRVLYQFSDEGHNKKVFLLLSLLPIIDVWSRWRHNIRSTDLLSYGSNSYSGYSGSSSQGSDSSSSSSSDDFLSSSAGFLFFAAVVCLRVMRISAGRERRADARRYYLDARSDGNRPAVQLARVRGGGGRPHPTGAQVAAQNANVAFAKETIQDGGNDFEQRSSGTDDPVANEVRGCVNRGDWRSLQDALSSLGDDADARAHYFSPAREYMEEG